MAQFIEPSPLILGVGHYPGIVFYLLSPIFNHICTVKLKTLNLKHDCKSPLGFSTLLKHCAKSKVFAKHVIAN